MTSVSIVGSGNIATHIGRTLDKVGVMVTHLSSRNPDRAKVLAEQINAKVVSLEELPSTQLVLVCVSDDAITEVLQQIPSDVPVAYTSGSVEMKQVPFREKLGVFYPLQTFSKTADVDMKSVPILIEANALSFQDELVELAKKISRTVQLIDSQQRAQLHIAAVWINNFTNHIVYQAQELTRLQKVDYQLLLPLLKETIRKLETQSAFDAQTGPARRGDKKTLAKQAHALEGTARELYLLLTKSIQETYRDEEL